MTDTSRDLAERKILAREGFIDPVGKSIGAWISRPAADLWEEIDDHGSTSALFWEAVAQIAPAFLLQQVWGGIKDFPQVVKLREILIDRMAEKIAEKKERLEP